MSTKKIYFILLILITVLIFACAAICGNCTIAGAASETKSTLGSGPESSGTGLADESTTKTGPAGESTTKASDTGTSGQETSSTLGEDASSTSQGAATSTSSSNDGSPTINIKIYEGPVYSAADNIYYFRIEATITGSPLPVITWSRDDSVGAWGNKKVQINLNPGESYALSATAKNSVGTALAAIVLTAPGSSSSTSSTSGSTSTTEDNGQDNEAPSVNLVIYEGPTYSAANDVCFYRIKAVVTGNPAPVIIFNKDDSNGAFGQDKAQINIARGQTFTLIAKVKNSAGEASASIALAWGCGEENSPPDVSELFIRGVTHQINSLYTIYVNASDPDGDELSYNWTVSSGSLSGNNTRETNWRTPDNVVDCILTVTVSDGKGQTVTRTKKVKLSPPVPVTYFPFKIVGEGGTIEQALSVSNGGNLYAGDTIRNKPCAGFVSFDISGLAGGTIQSASISFICSAGYGDPLSPFDELRLYDCYWGPRPVGQQDLLSLGYQIAAYDIATFACDSQVLVNAIQENVNSGMPRFQIMIHFAGYCDGDGIADGWEYSQDNIKLKITCTRPVSNTSGN